MNRLDIINARISRSPETTSDLAALVKVAEAAEAIAEYLPVHFDEGGHECRWCGGLPGHIAGCEYVALKAALAPLLEEVKP